MSRLREVEFAERSYLIWNGWRSLTIQGHRVWIHDKEHPHHVTQDEAVRVQKQKDRSECSTMC
jgi:hypothetical protein